MILYCGDTHLRNAAAYLAGVLTSGGESFRYLPSDQSLQASDLATDIRLLILSDYPAQRVAPELQQQIVQRVSDGTGLLMIGGWESFHGLGGNWDGTPVGDILPVRIESGDDRINSDRPLLVRRTGRHAVTRDLPWKQRPPYVGGLNRLRAREGADVLLKADELTAGRKRGRWKLDLWRSYPLLVVGQHGAGRTTALATDLAPHWVGGFVDWGDGRVPAQAADADPVEVGDLYAQFILQLVRWNRGE